MTVRIQNGSDQIRTVERSDRADPQEIFVDTLMLLL